MPRRLKVYFAQLGFYESVVAAPSQAEALKAWGVHQDLIASGEAKVVTAPQARAALSHPGVPLRRAIGGDGKFSLDPAPPKAPGKTRKVASKSAPKVELDRAALDDAEARLGHLEDTQARGEADFYRRHEALAAEETAARREWSQARKAAQRDLQRARRAYVKSGGKA
jgi:hypothetical protein